MERASEVLLFMRGLAKLHELYLEPVRERHGLSSIEVTIMGFLHNHPEKDTLSEISEMRMLQKGNASQAVEALIRKGFLLRVPDREDRRRVHLSVTEPGHALSEEIEAARMAFMKQLFTDFSDEERAVYTALNERICKNMRAGLKRAAGKTAVEG